MDSGGSPTVNKLLDREKMISISKPSYLYMPAVNSIASVNQTKILKDAMQLHHAAFNNCAKSTLLTAASKGILHQWPLLTRSNISKYVTETQATHMGHMQRIRQNMRSTRKEVLLFLQNLETEGIDINQEKKCGEVYLMVLDIRIINSTIYTNLTRAFPVTSARTNKLLYISYI